MAGNAPICRGQVIEMEGVVGRQGKAACGGVVKCGGRGCGRTADAVDVRNDVLLTILVGVGVLAHVVVDMGGVLFPRLDGRQDGLELADLLRRKVVRRHLLRSGVEEVNVRRRLAYRPDEIGANNVLDEVRKLVLHEGRSAGISTGRCVAMLLTTSPLV